METLCNVPDDRVLDLFSDVRRSFDKLPNDQEILTYYRRSPKYTVKIKESKQLVNVGQDIGHMRQMADKFPNFKQFLDIAEKDPNGIPPRDVHKWFCKELTKTFNL